jgi:choline dehydrogenase-like flavoprotein
LLSYSGKGLGGSSGLNFYVFAQPPASDIDGTLSLFRAYPLLLIAVLFVLAIEKLGNPGWNWEAHLRYSRKSERYVTFQRVGVSLYLLLLTPRSRFTPPTAQEAAAERLHFNPAHHGTDGEQYIVRVWIAGNGCRSYL